MACASPLVALARKHFAPANRGVPKAFDDRIRFFESRVAAIEEHAAALGRSHEDVVAFRAQVDAARAAYQLQYALQTQARGAADAMHLAVEALNRLGGGRIIKACCQARLERDPLLLNLIRVRPIANKSPIGKPGTPFDLTTRLDGVGNLKLIWKPLSSVRTRTDR